MYVYMGAWYASYAKKKVYIELRNEKILNFIWNIFRTTYYLTFFFLECVYFILRMNIVPTTYLYIFKFTRNPSWMILQGCFNDCFSRIYVLILFWKKGSVLNLDLLFRRCDRHDNKVKKINIIILFFYLLLLSDCVLFEN